MTGCIVCARGNAAGPSHYQAIVVDCVGRTPVVTVGQRQLRGCRRGSLPDDRVLAAGGHLHSADDLTLVVQIAPVRGRESREHFEFRQGVLGCGRRLGLAGHGDAPIDESAREDSKQEDQDGSSALPHVRVSFAFCWSAGCVRHAVVPGVQPSRPGRARRPTAPRPGPHFLPSPPSTIPRAWTVWSVPLQKRFPSLSGS